MKRILSFFFFNQLLLIVGFPTVTKANNISNANAVKTYQRFHPFPLPFDSTLIAPFCKISKIKIPQTRSCPTLQETQLPVLWYDSDGMNEFAALLYDTQFRAGRD
jgi:hypothetical protein